MFRKYVITLLSLFFVIAAFAQSGRNSKIVSFKQLTKVEDYSRLPEASICPIADTILAYQFPNGGWPLDQHWELSVLSEEALAKVSQDFRNHLASASDIEKVYLATSFAQIVYDATGSANLAIDILLEFPPAESVSDWVKIEYYAPLGGYYERIGDEEKVAEYNNVIDGLMPRLEARPVERKSDDGSSGQDFSEEEQ